jgi:ABC-type methionine transport system permease subunit
LYQTPKFPTMADDALYKVQKALMEAGNSRGAKRWKTG